MNPQEQFLTPHPMVRAGGQRRDFGENLKVETDLVLADYGLFQEQVEQLVTAHLYSREDNPVSRAMALMQTLMDKHLERDNDDKPKVAGVKFHLQVRSQDKSLRTRFVVVLIRAWTLHYFSDPFFSSEFEVLLDYTKK